MTHGELIPILELLASLGFLVWFVRGPWQAILVDITRQRLFEIRDSIFLMAADGKLDFQSEPYLELRNRLNRSIRFCHNARVSRLIASAWVEDEVSEKSTSWSLIEKVQDESVRRDLEVKAAEAAMHLAALMVLRSPILLILSMPLVPILLVYELLSGGFKHLVAWVGENLERDIDLDARRPA